MSKADLMLHNASAADEAELLKAALDAQGLPFPTQPLPWLTRVSGLYTWSLPFLPTPIPRLAVRPTPGPGPEPGLAPVEVAGGWTEIEEEAALPTLFLREELRLDVDGTYPQMAASGTLYRGLTLQVHWIANLTNLGPNAWVGTIWYKDGSIASFSYTAVRITAVPSLFPNQRRATVTFTGGGATPRTRIYRFNSAYFHPVEFEYDHETGVVPDLQIDTCAHPNRPASLPCQTLTIETVYRRAGFDAKRSGAVSPIPNDGPDPNTTWSDAEMHDAMQVYWSHFANKPQWSLWALLAKQHDMGSSLGGIMFDDIGPNHRQGTAIFYDSFISTAPPGDPAAAAWVTRMHFWTAVHEMGHAFNLAHSWQKHLGTPWVALAAEPEARSFMNYPYRVSGGQLAFFADFEFRFSDGELLFMRHAPERFVEMGNADWFDHHGFQGAAVRGEPAFELEIGVDRAQPIFDFLEPVVLEVKLTNISNEPKIVPTDLLLDTASMVVILKKDGKRARRWLPYATHCRKAAARVLSPDEEITESLFISTGLNGWDLAEPGLYTVQIAMEIDGADVLSNALRVRVAPARSYDEEYLAQDVFTDEAGRVMAFDGSRALESGMNAWRALIDRLPDSKAAVHARVALAVPLTRNYRVLRIDAPAEKVAIDRNAAFAVVEEKPDEAREQLEGALLKAADTAPLTLGRVDYEYYCETFAGWLKASGEDKEAKHVDDTARKAVAKVARHYPAAKRRVAPKVAAE